MFINYLKVKLTLAKFRYYDYKPSIDRVTKKYQGFRIGSTHGDRFIKVQSGYRVQYFPVGKVFYNVHRIVSRTGTPDYITHRVL